MTDAEVLSQTLIRDYERIALAGVKLLPGLGRTDDAAISDTVDTASAANTAGATNPAVRVADPNGKLSAALSRLVAVGLAKVVGDVVILQQPQYAAAAVGQQTAGMLGELYDFWLRAGGDASGDEVLHGEAGFWHHWWNAMQLEEDRAAKPLSIDAIIAADARIVERQLLAEADTELIEYVLQQQVVYGRVIVPPAALGSIFEAFVDLLAAAGLAIRVLNSPHHVAIFDADRAVLRGPAVADGIESHRLTRNPGLVRPLQHLFELQWAMAIPWGEHKKGSTGVLTLLARGWTDRQIADATHTSPRTVSRRVARAMEVMGARSRFELGMKFALAELRTGGSSPSLEDFRDHLKPKSD